MKNSESLKSVEFLNIRFLPGVVKDMLNPVGSHLKRVTGMLTGIFANLLTGIIAVLLTGSCFLTISAQSAESLIEEQSIPFEDISDFNPLFNEIGDQRLILMGEATHGTSEFYEWRAELSKHLIEENKINFIGVEGDWPAFSRINKYVKHKPGAPETIEEAMNYIDRWPLWMWRNQEVKDLVVWLHDHNSDLPEEEKVGFYGVDLYAKQDAMEDVVNWLETVNPEVSREAESQYACLARFTEIRDYLQRVHQTGDDCSGDVARVLEKVQNKESNPEISGSWGYFNAEQNAKLVVNAERHYRANLEPGPASWNHRAGHFEQTSYRLLDYYGEDSSGIIWAHNTHIGDARATEMGPQGMENIGQLSRERWGDEGVYAIGFGTYEGEVFAAAQWEGAREAMQIPNAAAGSWEEMLYQTGFENFYLLFSDDELNESLSQGIPHRAIGVTFQPLQEARNYVNTVLPGRYNAFIYFRETTVLDAFD